MLDPAAELSLGSLSDAIERHCDEVFTEFLSGDAVNIGVQGIVATTTKGTGIIYEFSKDALDLCQQGKARIAIHSATGKYLPYIQDQSGKIIDQAKGVVSHAARLTQIASIVISAAHIISGIDISRRLATLQRGVDYLLAEQLIEKESRLRRILQEARSISHRDVTPSNLERLVEMRYDLRELREHLGQEIKLHLAALCTLPNRHPIHPTSWLRRESRENSWIREVSVLERKQELASIALLLDAMLAMHSGITDDLWNNSLPRDSAQWAQLEAAASDAASRIRRAQPRSDFAGITACISQHVGLIGGLGAHSANLLTSI